LLGRPLSQVGRVLDVANCYAANLVLVDTKQALEHFASDLGITRSKLEVVYVGAETDLFTPSPLPREDAQLHVLFYGSFIPLHGIEVVLRAAAVLQDRRANITLQLVGSGQEYRRMRLIARRLRLGNVEFGPARVAYDELPELISRADVCLGVFADRPKTMRVIPHKVFQSAACGRPVVTADTPAIREIFSDVTLALVDPGNPIALADELTALAGDRPRRAALAHAASSLVRDQYSPTAIAARLLDRFSRL